MPVAWGTLSGCLLLAGVAGGCKPDTRWLHEHCWRRHTASLRASSGKLPSVPGTGPWEVPRPLVELLRQLPGPEGSPGGGRQAPEQDVRVESGTLVSSLGPCVCPHPPSPVTAHQTV